MEVLLLEPRMTEPQVNDYFKRVLLEFGNNPNAWLMTASDLIKANDILKENHFLLDAQNPNETLKGLCGPVPVLGPRLMLCAFALECYLKALFIAKGNKIIEDGNFIGPGHHDLEKLAKNLGILEKFSSEEVVTIKSLTWYGIKGRYPVFKKSSEEEKLMGWNLSHGDEHFKNILLKIEKEIKAARKS